jgi:hypothetical protein
MPNELKLSMLLLFLAISSNFFAIYKFQKVISIFLTGFTVGLCFMSVVGC